MNIYIASKVKYSLYWLELRQDLEADGHKLVSTWIDEAGQNESPNIKDLAGRCIKEAFEADITILYCEREDLLKGALVEVGAALAGGKKVYQVGNSFTIPKVFREHENWFVYETIQDVIEELVNLNTQ